MGSEGEYGSTRAGGGDGSKEGVNLEVPGGVNGLAHSLYSGWLPGWVRIPTKWIPSISHFGEGSQV